MTQGFSGSYGINGTVLSLQPSQGQWSDKEPLGRDGSGRPIYPAFAEFTLQWGLMGIADLKQINDAYLAVSNTGTAVVDLPKWGDSDYRFYSYSGTVLSRPSVGGYFAEYVEDVSLVISSIRVD